MKSGLFIRIHLLILIIMLIPCSCSREGALVRIKDSGEITMLTRNNAHSYYYYREEPMGFEYDLALAFSRHLGVELRIKSTSWTDLIPSLKQGEADFIAASMSVLPSRAMHVNFSREYLTVQQQVIVNAADYNTVSIKDLSGKTICVRRGTSYEERLNQLRRQGLDINIRLYDDIPTEELIRMVADKEIDITVADSNVALLNRRYYPDIRIAFPLEEVQSLGWAVDKSNVELLDEINRFFEKIKKDGTFAAIYEKYYNNVEIFDYFDLKKYHQRLDTRLPRYKEAIKEASGRNRFDWRLIAAVAYQESHLDPEAESHTGVKGIMQLTRKTAEEMGIEDRKDPDQSITAGVDYLRKLYDRYEKAQDPDRLLIALASYNVGHGHIRDAQKIATEKGLNPYNWASMEEILPLLSYPGYYTGTRYGYCRGTEPVRYVNRILTYYDILKREAISKEIEKT